MVHKQKLEQFRKKIAYPLRKLSKQIFSCKESLSFFAACGSKNVTWGGKVTYQRGGELIDLQSYIAGRYHVENLSDHKYVFF